jgi:hypothetical protein
MPWRSGGDVVPCIWTIKPPVRSDVFGGWSTGSLTDSANVRGNCWAFLTRFIVMLSMWSAHITQQKTTVQRQEMGKAQSGHNVTSCDFLRSKDADVIAWHGSSSHGTAAVRIEVARPSTARLKGLASLMVPDLPSKADFQVLMCYSGLV